MEALNPTRQEIRAILANPESTQEQVLQTKHLLAKRIANGSNAVRQICEKYRLTPEQSEKLAAEHRSRLGEMEAWAVNEMQAIKIALAELHGE